MTKIKSGMDALSAESPYSHRCKHTRTRLRGAKPKQKTYQQGENKKTKPN